MTTLFSIPCVDVLNHLRMHYNDLLELEQADASASHYARDLARSIRRLRFSADIPANTLFEQARAERRIVHYLLNVHMSRLAFADGNDRPDQTETLRLLDRHLDGIRADKRAGRGATHAGALNVQAILRALKNELVDAQRYEALPVRIQ